MPQDVASSPDEAPVPAMQYPLVVVAGAIAAGILGDRFLSLPAASWWLAAIGALLVWLIFQFRLLAFAALCALLLAIACTGAAWHHWHWNLFHQDETGRAATADAQPVCLQAVALTGPRRRPAPPRNAMRAIPQGDETRLTVVVTRIRDKNQWRAGQGRAEVIIDGHLLGASAGDTLQIFGHISRPQPPANPGEFDFAAHSRADRKLAVVRCNFPDCVTIVDRGSFWNWRRTLDTLREQASRLLWNRLSIEQSPLASAILLGAREQTGRDQTEAFFKTGTIHLMAISGLHVGILAGILLAIARTGVMPRRVALLAVVLITAAYCLLTDARPPVVRATILIVSTCFAWMSWRRAPLPNTLALAAIVVLAINPSDLFRTGPQLSFLAVATLACFAQYLNPRLPEDPLDRLIARTRPWHVKATKAVGSYVWKLFVVSSIIWLVALPLVMYRFHLFSPVALLLNPLIAVPIALALLGGFGVLTFGWLLPPLAAPFAWLCDANLWLIQTLVALCERIANSHFWVAGPPLWWVVVFYAALALSAALPRWRPPARWCFALLAVWIAVGLVQPMFPRAGGRRELACTFLSVGHGSAVVVELPGGQTLLYDAGSLGSPSGAAQSIAGFLWSRHIDRIDAVVLSHADVDHYNALPDLLERFSVAAVYVSPVMFEDDQSQALAALQDSLQAAGVPVKEIFANDRLHVAGGANIEVLHPPRKGVLGSDNANSLVLLIEHTGRRILLPGDLEPPGLNDVLAEEPLDVDLAMAPHHGSRRSSPAGFAQWCTPEWVVISGGRGSDADEAAAAFLAAGAGVLHTRDAGAIRLTCANGELGIRTWNGQRW